MVRELLDIRENENKALTTLYSNLCTERKHKLKSLLQKTRRYKNIIENLQNQQNFYKEMECKYEDLLIKYDEKSKNLVEIELESKNKLEGIEMKCGEIEMAKKEMDAKYEDLDGKFADLNKKYEDLNYKNADLNAKCEDLKEKMKILKAEKKKAEDEKKKLKTDLEKEKLALIEQNDKKECKNCVNIELISKKKDEEYEKKISKIIDQEKIKIQDLEEKIKEIELQNLNYKLRIKEFTLKNDFQFEQEKNLKNELEIFNKKNEEYKKQIKTLENLLKKTEESKNNEMLKKEIEIREIRLLLKESELETRERFKENYNEKILALKNEKDEKIKDLNLRLKESQEKIQSLEKIVNEKSILDSELEYYKERERNVTEKEKKRLSSRFACMQDEIKILHEKFQTLEKSENKIQSILDLKNELIKEKEKEIISLKEEMTKKIPNNTLKENLEFRNLRINTVLKDKKKFVDANEPIVDCNGKNTENFNSKKSKQDKNIDETQIFNTNPIINNNKKNQSKNDKNIYEIGKFKDEKERFIDDKNINNIDKSKEGKKSKKNKNINAEENKPKENLNNRNTKNFKENLKNDHTKDFEKIAKNDKNNTKNNNLISINKDLKTPKQTIIDDKKTNKPDENIVMLTNNNKEVFKNNQKDILNCIDDSIPYETNIKITSKKNIQDIENSSSNSNNDYDFNSDITIQSENTSLISNIVKNDSKSSQENVSDDSLIKRKAKKRKILNFDYINKKKQKSDNSKKKIKIDEKDKQIDKDIDVMLYDKNNLIRTSNKNTKNENEKNKNLFGFDAIKNNEKEKLKSKKDKKLDTDLPDKNDKKGENNNLFINNLPNFFNDITFGDSSSSELFRKKNNN